MDDMNKIKTTDDDDLNAARGMFFCLLAGLIFWTVFVLAMIHLSGTPTPAVFNPPQVSLSRGDDPRGVFLHL